MLLTWHMPSKSVHKHGGCGHGGDKPKGLQNQERIFASTLGRSHSRCTENKPFELFVTQTSSSAHTYATTPRRRFSVIERPPGVPFQKIQFGNERGGISFWGCSSWGRWRSRTSPPSRSRQNCGTIRRLRVAIVLVHRGWPQVGVKTVVVVG